MEVDIPVEELEKSLSEAGTNLLSPPTPIPELLASLDLLENLLQKVDQSPAETMKEALAPSTKALVAEVLFRHPDDDVKVAVASCISEITRITAPDAPYEDDQMKEVFQLFVSCFKKWDDKLSRSFAKRVSILDTVAKVRSCVVMLDLECDGLIIEMFRNFFTTIRDDQYYDVLSCMETIMVLVVEESEEISADLISLILSVLKKQNKEIHPIACKLAEKVIGKCASKLRPYLLQAVKARGASLLDYSKVLVDICQDGDETVKATGEAVVNIRQAGGEAFESTHGDAANKIVAEENNLVNTPSEKPVEVAVKALEDAPAEEISPSVVGSPQKVTSNGIFKEGTDIQSAASDNSDGADPQDENAEPSNSGILQEGTDETSAANDIFKERYPAAQDEQSEPSNPSNCVVRKAIDCTSEANDNSKEAHLILHDGKAEPCNPSDGILEKAIENTPETNESSAEADADVGDKNAEPSDTCNGSHQEGVENTSATNDNSKEADVDVEDTKAEPSITSNDSHQEDANNISADDDNSKEADFDMQEKAKAEPSNLSDGILVKKGSDSSSETNDNSKKTDLDTRDEKAEPSNSSMTITDSVGANEPPKSKTKPKKMNKRKGKRSNSKKKTSSSLKADVSSRTTEVIDTQQNENAAEDMKNIPSESLAIETSEAEGDEKSSKKQVPSPKISENERADISSPSPSGSLADETCSKAKGGKKKKDPVQEDETTSDVDSGKESDTKLKREATGSKSKFNKHANKKASLLCDQEESLPNSSDDTNKEDDNKDESDGDSAMDLVQETENVIRQRAYKKKREQAKSTPLHTHRKTPAKEVKKKTVARPKSTPKVDKDESDVEEQLRASSKRKHQIEEKGPKVYGRQLVGDRVKVWWPDDNKFYKGVVDSFDSSQKKHTILYDDGDVEVLNLTEEEWQLIDPSEEQATDGDSPDESVDEAPLGKKAKTSADTDATRGKTLSSAKKSGASSSKSKATPKSGSKLQHTSKIAAKSKEALKKVGKSEVATTGKSTKSLKSGNKLIDNALKSAKKSNDGVSVTPKSSSKSKQEKSVGVLKSKGKILKSGGKANKITNSDESEDESLEPERTPEMPKRKFQSAPKSQKSSKKRKLGSKH